MKRAYQNCIRTIVFLALLSAGLQTQALEPAKPIFPEKFQPEIATLVSTYLSYYHYGKTPIDDRVSRYLMKEYLSSLDPNRMFFLASDIKEFKIYEDKLDDHLMANPVELKAPFLIFNRYKQRVYERVEAILARLDQPFDFDKKEFFHYDRSELPWATSKAQLSELWRKRLKEEMVRFELREKPKDEYMELLQKRYNRLKKNIDEYEAPDILELYLSSLAETFDPHSSYLKPATKDNFDIQMGHSLEGIGATLTRDGEYTKVTDIVEGGPAHRGGDLQVNDKIIAVAQGDDKAEDVVDLRLDKVVKQIRGKKGTKVRLTVIPADANDQSETREIIIIRDKVEITSADATSEIKEVTNPDGRVYRFGVINIPSFYMDSGSKFEGDKNYKSTTRDVRKLLDGLKEDKVDGLVIDLRQNGGGSLDEAIRLTGLFINDGPVVQIKDHVGKIRVEDDPDKKLVYDGPLMVLTSVFSASASEIFASAIQDYDRGLVVGGTTTHGKGTVQNIIGLQSSLSRLTRRSFEENVAGALKLTTHKFYRISGGSTQEKGVKPDIILPSPYDGLEVTEGSLDYALPWDEIDPVRFELYNRVRESLPFLRTNSAKRIGKDPEFVYLKEDISEREQREKEKRVSLNLADRQAEKERLEKRGDDRDKERRIRIASAEELEEDKKVPVPDFILNESLYIMRDFLDFKGNRIAGASKSNGKKESL